MKPKVIEALEEATGSDARWNEKLSQIAEAGRSRDTPDYQAERDEAVALLRELRIGCQCHFLDEVPKEEYPHEKCWACRCGAFLEKVGR